MEPKDARPLGDAPSRLPIEALPFWRELAEMMPAGVLRYSDRWAVELCARLMEKAVRRPSVEAMLELIRQADMSADDAKLLARTESISAAELSTLRSLLGALGLTPADRTKLSVSPEKPKNAFADLAQEAKARGIRPN